MAISEVRPSTEAAAERPKNMKRSSILGSLREAINKVRFLLSFSATRWMLLASVGARRGSPRRSLSFDVRPPGLIDVEGGIASPASSSSSSRTSRSTSLGTASSRSLSRGSSAVSSPEAAASSGGSPPAASSGGDSDIDRRADLFIDNFRRHLQMERQVSLELRYVRLNSWDRTPSF